MATENTGGVAFAKGHGTENDFVVLPDPDGALELTAARVRALCDRRRGLGADGVLRIVRTAAVADAPAGLDPATWFMDYRNSDGSIAEMCGNGLRLFARYLVDLGLAELGEFTVGTRAGARPVVVHPDQTVTVQLGPARVVGRSTATVAGRAYDGIAVDVGNPHLVCATELPVAGFDLSVPPGHDPVVFPHGVNVEFINGAGTAAGDARLSLRMRVHERGVGETRSCGTGTVAAVAAALHLAGRDSGESTVDVLGGTVLVTIDGQASTLTGATEVVAEGVLSRAWWDRANTPG